MTDVRVLGIDGTLFGGQSLSARRWPFECYAYKLDGGEWRWQLTANGTPVESGVSGGLAACLADVDEARGRALRDLARQMLEANS